MNEDFYENVTITETDLLHYIKQDTVFGVPQTMGMLLLSILNKEEGCTIDEIRKEILDSVVGYIPCQMPTR